MKKYLLKISVCAYLAFMGVDTIAQTMVPLQPQSSTYSFASRGCWFQATSDFVITGLRVPIETRNNASVSTADYWLATSPTYSTTGFTTQFYTTNEPKTNIVPMNVNVTAGEYVYIIGVGDGTYTSYSNTTMVRTIAGSSVTFKRLTDGNIRTAAPTSVGLSTSNTLGRIEIYWKLPFKSMDDAGVASIDAPTSAPCGGGNSNVTVTVQNFGFNAINGVDVNWTVNGVAQTPVSVATILDTLGGAGPNTTQVSLGTVNITGSTTIKAWTVNPNAAADTFNINDTSTISVSPPLNGIYTIDALGSGPNNYTNFVDAAADLNFAGVCGPVEFHAASGTYIGQVVLNSVTGLSSTNTLLFTADSNNTAPVVIQSNVAAASTSRGAFRMAGVAYVTLDGLEIEHTLNTSYCDVLVVENAFNNITIENCYIHRPYYTSSLANSLYIRATSASDNITIRNNRIEGGYYGMYLYGWSGSRMTNLVVENNIAEAVYYYPMYVYYIDAPKIHDNYAQAVGALSTPSSQAFRMYYCDSADVQRNTFHGTNYGMYLYDVEGGNFYNNKIMIGDTGLNLTNGLRPIYMNLGNNNNFIHNAIISQSNNGNVLWFDATTSGNKVYNNIFSNIGTGSGINLASPFGVSEMDYNAYDLDSAVNGGLSYTMAFGFDSNSISVTTPIYDNMDSLVTCNTELPARGTYMMDVPQDYSGVDRFMGAPTIGPHEYLAPGSPVLGDDFLLCGSGPVEYVVPLIDGASYLWSNGDTVNTLTVTAPGSYSVSVTGLSCGSGILQDDVEIGDASSIADYSSERSWKTVSFTNASTNAFAYMWDFGDGQTSTDENPIHLYDANGMYNACLTAYGDCDTVTTCDSVFAHNAVGVAEFAGNGSIAMYPNPASSLVTIEADGIEGNVLSIEVSNIAGQIVLTSQLNDFNGYVKRDLAVGDLNEGIYFVKLFTSEFTNTQRLVIRR